MLDVCNLECQYLSFKQEDLAPAEIYLEQLKQCRGLEERRLQS